MSPAHTIADVATACGVAERTIREWIRTGELEAINVSRTLTSRKVRLRVTDDAFRRFLEARKADTDADGTPHRRRSRKPLKQYV